MKCPQCGQDANIPNPAAYNVEAYGDPVLVNMNCCGKPVIVSRSTYFVLRSYEGNRTVDDWGDPIKKESKT